MGGGVENLVQSGPLILAVPIAAAAGAVTFLSPCCLPLVPGYLSYVTGMSGADAQRPAVAGPSSVADGGHAAGAEPGPRAPGHRRPSLRRWGRARGRRRGRPPGPRTPPRPDGGRHGAVRARLLG